MITHPRPPHPLPAGRPPTSPVTKENYYARATAFMEVRADADGKLGVMLDKLQHPAKWAAWLAYFRSHRINKCGYMKKQAKTYMVPAEWPHVFDAEATMTADHLAADQASRERAGEEQHTRERRKEIGDAMLRRYREPIPSPPWAVKAEGYWSWPLEMRERWDRENMVIPEGNRFPRDPKRGKWDGPVKAKYEPTCVAELRTLVRPVSAELRALLADRDRVPGRP